MAFQVSWSVTVDGASMTDRWNPYLTSIEVSDKDGTASDTANLTFDDSEGQCILPSNGGRVEIELEGVKVFEGTVDEVRSTGARGQGRLLTVSCKGFDSRGKAKEPQDFHKDDATLKEFLEDSAKRAGLKGVRIDPDFAQIKRDYWSADSESFIHLGERIARELGGTFKVRGDTAVLAKRGEGASPAGGAMPSVVGAWGDNLLSWDIAPFVGRPRHTKARVRWFDRNEARWKEEDVEVQGDTPPATASPKFTAKDKDTANRRAKGKKSESERDGGEGSVRILLDPTAQAEGTFMLIGARPGIDGEYRISSVTHKCDRSGGSITALDLKQPKGDAGKDKRSAGGEGT
ncbi:MAG: late control D family protein [Beijerinckiaceae bacterium]|nr:late control D family protein [Beijerinckiaceae bacterium]